MKTYNFSAGPAMLPHDVMLQAQQEFLDWNQTGCSVQEVSHRGSDFMQLAANMQTDLRELLNIPDDYAVLFLPAGSQAQFAFIPMHLKASYQKAAYVRTGVWSNLAYHEANRYLKADLVCDTEKSGYHSILPQTDWQSVDDAAYLYYCDNETVNGVEFSYVPKNINVPLVCDMSSNILSRPIDVSQYGIIFACSQKNLGAAGVTTIIIKKDLLDRTRDFEIPSVFDYKKQIEKDSMYNTPVTYAWYTQSLVLKWLKQQGGTEKMAQLAQQRSSLLYDYIDQSDFYLNKVEIGCRSRMNVPFFLADESRNQEFLDKAKSAGLAGLKGHRLVGGMRASIYNAMPVEGVHALVDFMRLFSGE
ncbi:MAG: 3-phosphoserine/phosphohydroxythreonine transaminase [Gammaproteobacteria bacterium]|nr:3-phosphoserine/phosphohydroxythreonine transaminase [Gammaproteobacteria bacterium]MCH9744633.1 3-phosphoserine/phosphohydroxythreonine transaminase [Gammaproteobacteria bacterium]